jgi:acyl-CoA thioesterase-2
MPAERRAPEVVTTPAQPQVDRLVRQLQLDQLDRDLFVGDPGRGERRLFGGLVAAQSVVAAYRTVEAGALHSLHAYFLRPGRHGVPIRYVVYRIRDGRTFTTRDVVAYQSGEAIFNVSTSFARAEEGVSHQGAMPDVPGPDGLPDWEMVRPDQGELRAMMNRWRRESPIEVRAGEVPAADGEGAPRRRVWIRPKGTLPDDPMVHAAVLTYASDMGLIATARIPHSISRGAPSAASLDHALWFHHEPRFDGWLLYTSESPIAHAARALILGELWRPDGTRVASVAQEGLIRVPRPEPRA